MKKETVILIVVITFLVGFITGATVAILKGKKGVETAAVQQKPQMAPPSAPPGPSPVEVASKIKTLKEIVQKDPKNLPAWVELGNLILIATSLKRRSRPIANILPPSLRIQM